MDITIFFITVRLALYLILDRPKYENKYIKMLVYADSHEIFAKPFSISLKLE